MRFIKFVAFLLLLITCFSSAQAQKRTLVDTNNSKANRMLDQNMGLMMDWLVGEFNNFQQVWKEEKEQVDQNLRHQHLHSIFTPVEMPKIGNQVFYVKQYLDDDPEQIYRQGIYRFKNNAKEGAIQLDIFSFQDKQAADQYRNAHLNPQLLYTLSEKDLRATSGCEIFWKKEGDHFVGYTKENSCTYISSLTGQPVLISNELKLSQDGLSLLEISPNNKDQEVLGHQNGIPHQLKRCRPFKGSLSIQKTDTDEFYQMRDILIHDQGQRISLVDQNEAKTKFSVELAKVLDPTGQEMLQLRVFEEGQKKSLVDIWTNPEATQIGVNMRSINAEFKLVE